MTEHKAYISTALQRTANVDIMGHSAPINFSGLADGCVGVLLVFDSEESAKTYAPDYGTLAVAWDDDDETNTSDDGDNTGDSNG